MPANRGSYLFLCLAPVLIVGAAGPRQLRVNGLHQLVGVALFLATAVAGWRLGGHRVSAGESGTRRMALAGLLFLFPMLLIALLWVGLATPWDATAQENRMRYAVLLVGSVAVTTALVILRDLLHEAGDHIYSALTQSFGFLAGAAYLVWFSWQLGQHVARAAQVPLAPSVADVSNIFDTILFSACILTYGATAALAWSLGSVGWIGRGAARSYLAANLAMIALLALRGFAYPDPAAAADPWYMRPGFIAGIPAIPWFMPFLLGVLLLRRAGAALPSSAGPDVTKPGGPPLARLAPRRA